jgi:hypothetical protein
MLTESGWVASYHVSLLVILLKAIPLIPDQD